MVESFVIFYLLVVFCRRDIALSVAIDYFLLWAVLGFFFWSKNQSAHYPLTNLPPMYLRKH